MKTDKSTDYAVKIFAAQNLGLIAKILVNFL